MIHIVLSQLYAREHPHFEHKIVILDARSDYCSVLLAETKVVFFASHITNDVAHCSGWLPPFSEDRRTSLATTLFFLQNADDWIQPVIVVIRLMYSVPTAMLSARRFKSMSSKCTARLCLLLLNVFNTPKASLLLFAVVFIQMVALLINPLMIGSRLILILSLPRSYWLIS